MSATTSSTVPGSATSIGVMRYAERPSHSKGRPTSTTPTTSRPYSTYSRTTVTAWSPPGSMQSAAAGAAFWGAFAQAEMNIVLGDHQKAEQLCRRALVTYPGRPEHAALLVWLEMVNAPKVTDDFVRSKIVQLDMALSKDPQCRRGKRRQLRTPGDHR